MTVTRELIVTNKVGLHARPAANFAKTAAGFKSKIIIENISGASKPVNAKSILSLLTVGVQKDHHIRLTIDGIDEVTAMDALAELVLNKCGEAE